MDLVEERFIMVHLEFQRPSTWSLGHKAGALSVLFLVLGPFLPFWERNYEHAGVDFVRYIEVGTFGFLFLIPLLSALLILLLLYFNFGVFIEEDGELRKINHVILMIWGPIFFIIYLADAVRASIYSTGYYEQYAGFGLWMIILGYFLFTLAGYLEWKRPQMTGPQILLRRKDNIQDEDIASENTFQYRTDANRTNPQKNPNTEALPDAYNLQREPAGGRIPTRSEESALSRWAEHASGNGRTFEQCLKCHRYSFITVKEKESSIVFQCTECKTQFTLKK